jgi:hypothetical protein
LIGGLVRIERSGDGIFSHALHALPDIPRCLVGIEHLTDDELEDLRSKCEARAKAEKFGEETVKETGEKSRKAARAAS